MFYERNFGIYIFLIIFAKYKFVCYNFIIDESVVEYNNSGIQCKVLSG